MGQAENERKKIFSFRSIPTQLGIGNFIKIAKKIKKKIKKHHSGFISSQNGTGQAESDTKKESYRSDPFLPDSE